MTKLLYIGNHLRDETRNPTYSTVLGPLIESEGVSLVYASSYSNKLIRLIHMLWATLYHGARVDRVLIDTYSTQNFYYAVLVGRLCCFMGVPYWPILHGGELPERLLRSPRLTRHLFSNAEKNIAPSLYIKLAFETRGFKNISYIPNVMELDQYPLQFPVYDRPKLLWVRAFSEIYNPEMAVLVLKNLRDKGYLAELCMVGPDRDGSMARTKALAVSLRLDVKFTGKLKTAEWVALANDYNIFINTAKVDNTPLSVMQAMALGLILISTEVGGIPYLVLDKQNGLLVPFNDIEAMSNAVEIIMTDEGLRKKLRLNSRQYVESMNWESVRELWLDTEVE